MKNEIIIKLTTAWKHPFFYKRTPGGKGVIGNYRFEIDNEINICDYWIIWGGLNPGKLVEKVQCPKQNVIFITDEVHSKRHFFQDFLNQFESIITPRKDLEHKNIIYSHELNTWHLNKSYDELIELKNIKKTKALCVISSNLYVLEGHKRRFEFVNKLIGHFKDKIDVYGSGINPFKDKFEVLAPYKYSIAIENNLIPGYFTEKLSECFLTHTIPIYYGCPDISQYFNPNSFYTIDINDYRASLTRIEAIIEEDNYYNHLENLLISKYQYLTQYDFFHAVVKILSQKYSHNLKRETITIKSEGLFERGRYLKRLVNQFNKQKFVSDKYKFNIEFYNKDKFSGNY